MNWTEITITVPQKDTDEAAAIANMTVPYGIYIEDYSDLEQGAREIARVRNDVTRRSILFWEIELMTVMTSTACIVVWMIFTAAVSPGN